jgi:hypothetical protein
MFTVPDLSIGDRVNMFTLKLQNVLDLNAVSNSHSRPTYVGLFTLNNGFERIDSINRPSTDTHNVN